MKKILLFALLLFAGWKAYEHFRPATQPPMPGGDEVAAAVASTGTPRIEADQTFSCDGRQHCSQMTSRAEAEFFVRNCPDTRMDGDRDGEPCENDSRF